MSNDLELDVAGLSQEQVARILAWNNRGMNIAFEEGWLEGKKQVIQVVADKFSKQLEDVEKMEPIIDIDDTAKFVGILRKARS